MAVDILSKFGYVDGLSPIGFEGSQKGYTIVNFALCYLIGAYIGKNNIVVKKRFKALMLGGCFAAKAVFMFLLILFLIFMSILFSHS